MVILTPAKYCQRILENSILYKYLRDSRDTGVCLSTTKYRFSHFSLKVTVHIILRKKSLKSCFCFLRLTFSDFLSLVETEKSVVV